MDKGFFITFEGGEGSGKSTQISLLEEYLIKNLHKKVVRTREPGGSSGAEEIRNLLVKGGVNRWDRLTELLLFSAARRDHLTKTIWPAVNKGEIVLSDRFADSTIAYQCFGYGFDEKVLENAQKLYHLIADDFEPDLTILLDIDPKIGLMRSIKRLGNDEQRFETMDFSFHENLRKGFLHLAEKNKKRFVVLDANQSPETLHQTIIQIVKEKITQ